MPTAMAREKARNLYSLLFDEDLAILLRDYVTKVGEVADYLGLKILRVNFEEFFKDDKDLFKYIKKNKVSGFLLESEKLIVVSAKESIQRQRFTIAHEIGHYHLNHISEGDLSIAFRNGETSSGTNKQEIEANAFAAEFLMPERLMRDVLEKTSDVSKIAKIFGVSEQAIRYRIKSLMK